MNESNVLEYLFIGTGITIIIALVIAGMYQELRANWMNKQNIKRAQMATAAKTIRKGHE